MEAVSNYLTETLAKRIYSLAITHILCKVIYNKLTIKSQ